MANLITLQKQTIGLFRTICVDPSVQPRNVAAPFISYCPASYAPGRYPSVLYVGRATHGGWYRSEFLRQQTMRQQFSERQTVAREFLEGDAIASPFWNFARTLIRELGEASWRIGTARNFIWSNLCKIGDTRHNPSGQALEHQRDHSIRVLTAEIAEYSPRLVMFVTGNYENSLIGRIVDDPKEKHWHRHRQRDVWWRPGKPAFLWTSHPQDWRNSAPEARKLWLERATSLVSQ
jgi:hypothetical protein